jgi:ABC-type glycerol-3-phosphate transport system permease component
MTLGRLWFYVSRGLIYVVLIGFALLMLFPFFYMAFTSLKNSDDVFNSPPRLLPRSAQTVTTAGGEDLPAYLLEVNGETRTMVPTGERVRLGYLTTADKINFTDVRRSDVLTTILID